MLRLDMIGDCTMFTSTAAAIRKFYKDSKMTILCLSTTKFVFESILSSSIIKIFIKTFLFLIWVQYQDIKLAVVVALSLLGTVVLANFLGCTLPIAASYFVIIAPVTTDDNIKNNSQIILFLAC